MADLTALAAVDRDLDRYTFAGGASIYPFAWNLLLAARAEGLGGVITTMADPPGGRGAPAVRLPETAAVAAAGGAGPPRGGRPPAAAAAGRGVHLGRPLAGTGFDGSRRAHGRRRPSARPC